MRRIACGTDGRRPRAGSASAKCSRRQGDRRKWRWWSRPCKGDGARGLPIVRTLKARSFRLASVDSATSDSLCAHDDRDCTTLYTYTRIHAARAKDSLTLVMKGSRGTLVRVVCSAATAFKRSAHGRADHLRVGSVGLRGWSSGVLTSYVNVTTMPGRTATLDRCCLLVFASSHEHGGDGTALRRVAAFWQKDR